MPSASRSVYAFWTLRRHWTREFWNSRSCVAKKGTLHCEYIHGPKRERQQHDSVFLCKRQRYRESHPGFEAFERSVETRCSSGTRSAFCYCSRQSWQIYSAWRFCSLEARLFKPQRGCISRQLSGWRRYQQTSVQYCSRKHWCPRSFFKFQSYPWCDSHKREN